MKRECPHCGENLTKLRGKHSCAPEFTKEQQKKILDGIKQSQEKTAELQKLRELQCTCCPLHGARY